MSERFFTPWIGDEYFLGLGSEEHCVLVLGASAYCPRKQCEYFSSCTSDVIQDSSEFNDSCPYPEQGDPENGKPENYSSFTKDYASLRKFCLKMEDRFPNLFEDGGFWSHVAFTNYIQYFLGHTYTNPDNYSARDMDAFLETLDELRPEVVVILGKQTKDILQDSQYTVEADDGDSWDFAWDYDNMYIRFIQCTHPSAHRFYSDFPMFAKKYEKTLHGNEYDADDEEQEEDSDDSEDEDGEDCANESPNMDGDGGGYSLFDAMVNNIMSLFMK